ncbi:Uncharacterised protein [Haploplasma axanthum]|uniref:Uncharacterized protein n=1 Tax=Haploplasma axanthum TaxID=29552 RepID=A0A449BB67_HAPAX|nr:Uncharacterised protein [Haploplasma axanthum]
MFGYKVGEILKRIHKTKIEYKDSWSKIYNKKLDRKINESIKYKILFQSMI